MTAATAIACDCECHIDGSELPAECFCTPECVRGEPYADGSGTYVCQNHNDRDATAYLDWQEDYAQVCDECLMPTVRELWETLQDQFLGVPEITIRPI